MPFLGHRSSSALCPRAATLQAVAGGATAEGFKSAITIHLAQCPACRDLQQRLQNFDAPTVGEPQAEWDQTEKRLDIWLDGFLLSDLASYHASGRVPRGRFGFLWGNRTCPSGLRRSRWALVPAATLAMMVLAFLAGRVSVSYRSKMTAEVAASKNLSLSPVPPSPLDRSKAAKTLRAAESQLPRRSPHPPVSSAAGIEAALSARELGLLSEPSAGRGGQTETAATPPRSSINSEKLNALPGSELAQNATDASPQAAAGSPSVEHDQALRTA